ncbi:hypothetical protein ACQJBY_068875 [Aegilops geniculata]
MAADGAAVVEILRAELARAKEQARFSNVAAEKASVELKAEQVARHQDEEKISTMALELKNAASRCEFLEKENKAKTDDLDKALREAKEARSESRAAREEIRQNGEIVADVFLDLPKSSSDVAQFYQAQEGYATEKLFWSQFGASKRPLLLNEQMSQWAELHRISGAAMKNVIIRLWPTEPIPNSYFGLVQRLVDATPRIDAVRRSVCIEGARMAFARVKTYWGNMKAIDVAAKSPPQGKDHHAPEHYFEDVLEAARLIEGQCSKGIIFE